MAAYGPGAEYWLKQQEGQPLFSDLIWSQPQHSAQAGKLLIIGGNIHGFSAPAKAYSEALLSGAGRVKVLLPDVLRKNIAKVLPDADYAPSTPSGSLANRAFAEAVDHAAWSDLTLLIGDIGRNSETAMLHEAFCNTYKGLLCVSRDALDCFTPNPKILTSRPKTLIISTLAQLQRITTKAYPNIVISSGMSLLQLVGALHILSQSSSPIFITKHSGNILVAANGLVSTTKINVDPIIWRVSISAYASVWWLQNPSQPFEAATSAVSLFLDHTPKEG